MKALSCFKELLKRWQQSKWLPLKHEYFLKKMWSVCSWFTYLFTYACPIFFSYNFPCRRQTETRSAYAPLPPTAVFVIAGWAGRPGVRGRVADAESRKNTVQWLVSFCCHEQVINSLGAGSRRCSIHLSGDKPGSFTQRPNSPRVSYSLKEKGHPCHG